MENVNGETHGARCMTLYPIIVFALLESTSRSHCSVGGAENGMVSKDVLCSDPGDQTVHDERSSYP